MEYAKYGQKYQVISDTHNFFQPGEIVIALENSDIPYCVREKDFFDGASHYDYEGEECMPLLFGDELKIPEVEKELFEDEHIFLVQKITLL